MLVYVSLQAIAGLIADARQIVSQARDEASNYRYSYSQPIPLRVRNSTVGML